MSADLVTWLREQIAEDERQCEFNDEPESWCDRAEGVHYDSRRVLAEVTAKRAILDAMSNWQHEDPDEGGYYACPAVRTEPLGDLGPESFGEENCDCGVQARRRQIALLLAAPFASRPGFDPSWLEG